MLGLEGKVGQRCDGRGCVTHEFLLQAQRWNMEGARSGLFPIHRHHTSIVTRQSVPDSEEERHAESKKRVVLHSQPATGEECRYKEEYI